MLQSIIVYSLLVAAMLACAVAASKKRRYTTGGSGVHHEYSFFRFETLFPIILFSVLFGVRYDVGTDYLSYLYGYIEHIDVGKGEILFKEITHLFQYYNFHFSVYFGVIAFIQVFFFFYTFKRQRFLFPLLVFFLFMNEDFMFWMNGIRQALAMCIWLFALQYIEQRKFWKYFTWCLVAYGFHNSAITLIVLYPILRKGKDYFKSVSLQIILLASVFVIQQLFGLVMSRLIPVANFYESLVGSGSYGYTPDSLVNNVGKIQGSGLAYLFKILVNISIIFYSVRLKKFYDNRWFNIVYFLFFIGLLTLYIFPVGAIVLTRPFRYFYIFQTIMYAYFAYYLMKANLPLNKGIFYALIIGFLGIFYLNQTTASPDSHLWFQFYFDNI